MRRIVTQVDAADVLIVLGFLVLVSGLTLYAVPLALVVAGFILFALGIVGSR